MLEQIAIDVIKDWKSPYFGAVPYLQAMLTLDGIDDRYGQDSARSIVAYFLANSQSWRGVKAKEIKLKLKNLIK